MNLVKVNAGGIIYTTYESTLEKIPFFAGLFRKYSENDSGWKKKGEIFVDVNGKSFGYLLDYVRGTRKSVPKKHIHVFDYFCMEYPEEVPDDQESDDKELIKKGNDLDMKSFECIHAWNTRTHKLYEESSYEKAFLKIPNSLTMFKEKTENAHLPADVVEVLSSEMNSKCCIFDIRRLLQSRWEKSDFLTYVEIISENENLIDRIEWLGQTFNVILLKSLYEMRYGVSRNPKLILPVPSYQPIYRSLCLNQSRLEISIHSKESQRIKIYARGYIVSREEQEKIYKDRNYNLNTYRYSQHIFEPQLEPHDEGVEIQLTMYSIGIVREFFFYVEKSDGTLGRISSVTINGYTDLQNLSKFSMKEREYEVTGRHVPSLPIYNKSYFVPSGRYESGYLNLGQGRTHFSIISEDDDILKACICIVTYDSLCGDDFRFLNEESQILY